MPVLDAKLRKVTISLVMFVCPFVGLHGTTGLPLEGFSLTLILLMWGTG